MPFSAINSEGTFFAEKQRKENQLLFVCKTILFYIVQ